MGRLMIRKTISLHFFCVLLGVGLLTGCVGNKILPAQSSNICVLFDAHRDWFKAADRASRRWGIPIPVMMAIMHQESKFKAKAKPPRTTCFFVLPGPRPSSAYGYAQALDTTWAKYRKAADRSGADRDNVADALDFIGWYCHLSHVRCGIPVTDVYGLYLAYHEGHGGYSRQTYANKRWLKQVAQKVQRQAATYSRQLAGCEGKLRGGGCCLFPF
jgi:hypothetical protein